MVAELTPKQIELADALFTTKTVAKVGRRIQNPDGSYSFYHTERPTSPIDFPVNDEEFALKMHEEKPDAKLSPFYINLRGLPPELLAMVGEIIADQNFAVRPDYCSGIPDAGTPIAEAFSLASGIQAISIFGKENTEKCRRIIPIPYATRVGKDRNLLIVDDLITGAETKFEAIRAAEQLGYNITGVAVLVDREQGGAQQLEDAGYPLYAAIKVSPTFEYYRDRGMITPEIYQRIQNYRTA